MLCLVEETLTKMDGKEEGDDDHEERLERIREKGSVSMTQV